jgi:long-chain fatty acid transport protein
MIRFRTLTVALALVGAFASSAHAGGIATSTFAGEDGHVTTSHPSAAYYNPAGLALRGGTRFVLEGTIGYRKVGYTRPLDAIDNPGTGTPTDALSANSGEANLTNPVAVPFFAAATDFGVRHLGVGFSFSVPFGGSEDFDENQAYVGNSKYPGASDGVQRWSIINGTVQALYLTLAGAYYIPAAHLSVGVGLNAISQSVSVLRGRTLLSTDDLVSASGSSVEGRALIDVKSSGFSASAGLIWMPTEALRIGASYQSQPDFGKSTLSGDLTNKIGAAATAPTTPVDFEQELPDIIRFGGSYAVNQRWEVRGQFEYQRWSVFDKQCLLDATQADRKCAINPDGSLDAAAGGAGVTANLDRSWNDSFAVHAGTTYRLTPAVQLLGGITFDSNAIPDRTLDAAFVDSNKWLFTGQGRFELGGGFALSARWLQVVFATRETTKATPEASPTRVPSTHGKYTQSVGVFSLAAEYEF